MSFSVMSFNVMSFSVMSFNNASLTVTLIGLVLFGLSAGEARADLSYENIGGADLLYDSSTGTTWTRDGDISGETFDFGDANAWAAGLTVAGVTWELPTVAQFTSLFTDLYPYGAPGTEGDKYGPIVDFGAGPNDSALNVQTAYWTNGDQVDFNFFYGYGGTVPDADLLGAWAVVASPEPSPLLLLLAGLTVVAVLRRTNTFHHFDGGW